MTQARQRRRRARRSGAPKSSRRARAPEPQRVNARSAPKRRVALITVAATFGVGQGVFTLLWVFAFFVQIWLMVSIFIDVFRSDDLSGLAKAGWVVLVIAVPVIGILAYLIRRGDTMLVHRTQAARDARAQFGQTLQDLVGAPRSKADEIAQLAAAGPS